jgi:nicotinamide riboside kinase
LNIALLGAECTGKSTLAQALADGFNTLARQAGADVQAEAVPEALRHWCLTHERLPTAADQAEIARLQWDACQAARLRVGPLGWVVADTTPLMTAIYSEHYFSDTSLHPWALQCHRTADVSLLMTTDLPWVADGTLRDGPVPRSEVDALLRQRLLAWQVRHTVISGRGEDRLAQAWQVLARQMPPDHPLAKNIKTIASIDLPESAGSYFYQKLGCPCGLCSDPDCERQLFGQLRI